MLKSEWQINFKDSILLKSLRQITHKDLHKSTFYGLSVLWCKLTKKRIYVKVLCFDNYNILQLAYHKIFNCM